MLQMKKVVKDPVPVIKRFSGGGTVIVDHDTLFVTFICTQGAIQDLPLFPRPIASWTERFYKPVFKDNTEFQLRESGIYNIWILSTLINYICTNIILFAYPQGFSCKSWVYTTFGNLYSSISCVYIEWYCC